MNLRRTSIAAAAILLVAGSLQPAFAGDSAIFEKPVRLEADGKIIDTGNRLGHSGPTMADVDGDGIPDLVVGDFSGQFRVYPNLVRTGMPRLGPMKYLMAGGVPAKVPIYCCIGSSPLFVDFDGDGRLDLISGSYDPGACYLFLGLGHGQFAARETLLDKHNKLLLREPNQQQVYQSFGSWPALVDWDNDGDLDLLVGGFDGTIRIFLNEGTRTDPQFAGTNFKVQAAGKDVQVPDGHAAPVVVDWDGDGRWDILCGCARGSVYFYRNIGTRGPEIRRTRHARRRASRHGLQRIPRSRPGTGPRRPLADRRRRLRSRRPRRSVARRLLHNPHSQSRPHRGTAH